METCSPARQPPRAPLRASVRSQGGARGVSQEARREAFQVSSPNFGPLTPPHAGRRLWRGVAPHKFEFGRIFRPVGAVGIRVRGVGRKGP